MIIKIGTQIDFDPAKDSSNLLKHKYSLACMADIVESMLFGRIAAVFSDEYSVKDEMRYKVIAQYQGDTVLAVCTNREEGDIVRVISFRSASDEEEDIYRKELLENVPST
jgi:uncharacterized DUF497 family protein